MLKHIHARDKRIDENTASYFRQKLAALSENISSLAKYYVARDFGHATIAPRRGPEGEGRIEVTFNIRKTAKSSIPDIEAFRALLERVSGMMLLKKKDDIRDFYGGSIRFESRHSEGKKEIFVLEFRIRAKLRHGTENRPIRAIVSTSAECDADAILLYQDIMKNSRHDGFLLLKR